MHQIDNRVLTCLIRLLVKGHVILKGRGGGVYGSYFPIILDWPN